MRDHCDLLSDFPDTGCLPGYNFGYFADTVLGCLVDIVLDCFVDIVPAHPGCILGFVHLDNFLGRELDRLGSSLYLDPSPERRMGSGHYIDLDSGFDLHDSGYHLGIGSDHLAGIVLDRLVDFGLVHLGSDLGCLGIGLDLLDTDFGSGLVLEIVTSIIDR